MTKLTLYLIFLIFSFVPSFTYAQQGGVFNYVNIQPSTLPSLCSVGTIRVNTSTGALNYCGSSNTWSSYLTATTGPTSSSTLTSIPNLVTVGTIGTGTWAGTTVATNHGGTGVTSVTTSPTASSFAGWDANLNFSANAFFSSFATTATAAGTTTLTITSAQLQAFTGSTTQTVKLPTTSVATGNSWAVWNYSTGAVALQASGGGSIQSIAANYGETCAANSATPTTAAGWDCFYYSLTGAGGTPSFTGLTSNGVMYASNSTTIASAGAGTAGQVMTSNGSGSAPTMQVPATGQYAQAYFGSASSWSTTSSTFADPTNSGGNSLTVRQHSGITLTAASSNLPGITFTPASSSAVYLITATMSIFNGTVSDVSNAQLTDGTTVIVVGPGYAQGATYAFDSDPTTIIGIYAPGTTSSVTVKVQLSAGGGTASIGNYTSSSSTLEWTVIRIF